MEEKYEDVTMMCFPFIKRNFRMKYEKCNITFVMYGGT